MLVDECDAFSNEPYRPNWGGTSVEATFRSFWATVKSLLSKGIQRSFITGVLPYGLAGIDDWFRVARDISLRKRVAGLCGLTRSDIGAALKRVCGPNPESYKRHLESMTGSSDGYYFCRQRNAETLYNMETCLSYLQVRIDCLLRGCLHISLSVLITH